ncbi:MAG: hypothetical protein Q4B17_11945 [Lautropia sp.]|nr:hypothetical protein [Lautropia sp.]
MASFSPYRTVFLMLLTLSTGACGGGGGGGSDDGGSPNPGEPPASHQNGTPSPGNNGQPPADTGNPTPEPPVTRPEPQKPAGGSPALTADSLSGSLLATMLVQNTFVSQSQGGRPHPIYSLYGAVPWNARAGKPVQPADAPTAFGYQHVITDTQAPTGAATFHSASFITDFAEFPDFGRFSDVRTQVSIKLNLARESNPASLFLFTDAAIQAASRNTPILELDDSTAIITQVRAPTGDALDDETLRETYTLSSSTRTLALSDSTRLKLGQVLREWRDGRQNLMQLLVTQGTGANQIRLCLNYRLPKARRLHCSLWRVPRGWQFGRPLTYDGIQTQDDRSVHPGATGKRDWKTVMPG